MRSLSNAFNILKRKVSPVTLTTDALEKGLTTYSSSDNGSNPSPTEPTTDAPEEELTIMSITGHRERSAAWKRKTPDEKTHWWEENFGWSERPWAGEVAYDDGYDIEYQSRAR